MAEPRRFIILERRDRFSDWHRVRVEPNPSDGSRCTDAFDNYPEALLFARTIQRVRGWQLLDRSLAARQAQS